MDAVALYARGKINWALKVLGRRPDGYHELDTLFQSVEVGDVLRIQRAERDELVCGAVVFDGGRNPGNYVPLRPRAERRVADGSSPMIFWYWRVKYDTLLNPHSAAHSVTLYIPRRNRLCAL